jgi:hypothetical protein
MFIAARTAPQIDINPTEPFLPIRFVQVAVRFFDGVLFTFARNGHLRLKRCLRTLAATPRHQRRSWSLGLLLIVTHKAVPAMKIHVEEQMLNAALLTFGNNSQEEPAVDLGDTRYRFAAYYVRCAGMQHLKLLTTASALYLAYALKFICLVVGWNSAGSKVAGSWDHSGAFLV